MPWANQSRRRAQLPADWPQRRAAVKRRAQGRCEARVHQPTCTGIGNECDHIGDRQDHSLTNLQWLSKPCHTAKTQAESNDARPKRKRATPRHPGVSD